MNKTASFLLFAYNEEEFILDAVNSALSQTYSPLEIILSDDCSSDNTYKIMCDIVAKYKGPHKVILNRNEKNLGIREHCNKILYEMASGEYIFFAAGDDISDSRRVEECMDYFERFPEIMSISCRSKEVNSDLTLREQEYLSNNQFSILTLDDYCRFRDFIIFSGDSRALRKEVITAFPRLKYTLAEDIYLFIRSLMLGPCCYIRKPLVTRRYWGGNVSQKNFNKKILKLGEKQIYEDIDYAYEKKIISKEEYNCLKLKCKSIHTIFRLYWSGKFGSLETIIYRGFRKFFRLEKLS